jgi:hypothetical protein
MGIIIYFISKLYTKRVCISVCHDISLFKGLVGCWLTPDWGRSTGV